MVRLKIMHIGGGRGCVHIPQWNEWKSKFEACAPYFMHSAYIVCMQHDKKKKPSSLYKSHISISPAVVLN